MGWQADDVPAQAMSCTGLISGSYQLVVGLNSICCAIGCNPRQVITHVPLSSISIISTSQRVVMFGGLEVTTGLVKSNGSLALGL